MTTTDPTVVERTDDGQLDLGYRRFVAIADTIDGATSGRAPGAGLAGDARGLPGAAGAGLAGDAGRLAGAGDAGRLTGGSDPGRAGAAGDAARALRAASTILLADDHALVRSGLRLLLEEMGFRVVAEAGDVNETVRKTGAYKPSVLILDLNMPGGSSLGAIPMLKEVSPLTAIVVLTMQDEPAFAQHALRAGALGFVLKEAADDELVEALDAALDGRRYLNPQLGARIALQPRRVAAPPHDLTKRELQVLTLLARGHTNAEVAEQLFLSVRTVEAHRSHIQHKVGHISRSELVAYARDHGLVG